MDTSLRNRLTGAIILIVIAVALLPELLTGSGSKGRLALDDGHAADGPPLVSYKIDLTGNAPRPATAERDATPLAPAEATPSAPPAPPASAEPSAPASAAPAATPPATPTPTPSAATPTPTAVTPTPPATPPAPAEPPKSDPKVLVQVGSFRDRKAAEVRAKLLRARGFEVAITSNGADPAMYRVRVGPAGDRAAAEKLVKRLKVVKVDGSIVPAS